MSILYNTYIHLKKQDSDTIYLFKSGIFFIALDKDAIVLSDIFHFKLSNLNADILKCGFPCSSLDKYLNLFKTYNLNVKIATPDSSTLYNLNEYKQDKAILVFLDEVSSVDIDNLSVSEAYELLGNLKEKARKLKGD